MSLLITLGLGREAAIPGPQLAKPVGRVALNLEPDAVVGINLAPQPVSTEESPEDDYSPSMEVGLDLKPEPSTTIDLRPVMVSAEEE